MNQQRKYPETLVGMYKNNYSAKFTANSMALDQERADQICAAIQKCVGGRIEIKEAGGLSKNGKQLPDFFLEGVSAEIVAERKAFGATKKAESAQNNDGDAGL